MARGQRLITQWMTEWKKFTSQGIFSGRGKSTGKGCGDGTGQGKFQNGEKTTVAGPGAEGKSRTKPHVTKCNYKKFKRMLRTMQSYISMHFQNHNLRHFWVVVIHFLCRGTLSLEEYRKFFTYRKNLVQQGQLLYFVDSKANDCGSPE